MKFNFGNFKVSGSSLASFLKLFLLLFMIWLLLSGVLEAKFIIVGFVSALFVAAIFVPYLTVSNSEGDKKFFIFDISLIKSCSYCLWLLVEILKSSIATSKLVLNPKMEYTPSIIYFEMKFENPIASMLLANSITLTPGTITIDVDDEGIFEVHALNQEAAEGLMDGRMAYKVARLFNEKCIFKPMPEKTLYDIGTVNPKEEY